MPISVAARNAMLDALTARLNGGTLQIATDGTFSTVLATYTLGSSALPAASNGSTSTTLNAAGAATGNAEAWRFRNSSNATEWERSDADAISASAGGGVIVLNQPSTQIESGQQTSITITITQPAGV